MSIYCDKDSVIHSCGLEVVGDFGTDCDGPCDRYIPLEDLQFGHTGFFVAGFIEDDICKEAYKILSKKHKIVYQSPVRRNMNSGNMFYFVIFDSKKD